jgi:hypothetical protein
MKFFFLIINLNYNLMVSNKYHLLIYLFKKAQKELPVVLFIKISGIPNIFLGINFVFSWDQIRIIFGTNSRFSEVVANLSRIYRELIANLYRR